MVHIIRNLSTTMFVSYKRTGDTPQITITYKTAKKRPMWKKGFVWR